MRLITEYLSANVKPNIIHATDHTIRKIIKDELDRLGHDADLNHIDISEVTFMDSLFSCAVNNLGSKYKDLNPDISRWNVSKTENMRFIFYGCEKFNCDLSEWKTSKAQIMMYMFWGCKNFNQDISRWDVSKVEDMRYMFYGCENFNQDISHWDVSKVENMNYMFQGCKNFNQDLSLWNIQNVKYRSFMFYECYIKEEYKPKINK